MMRQEFKRCDPFHLATQVPLPTPTFVVEANTDEGACVVDQDLDCDFHQGEIADLPRACGGGPSNGTGRGGGTNGAAMAEPGIWPSGPGAES